MLWDQPNVIAVRIFDSGGDGASTGHVSLRMASPMDNLVIDTDEPFVLRGNDSLSKKITVRTSDGGYR